MNLNNILTSLRNITDDESVGEKIIVRSSDLRVLYNYIIAMEAKTERLSDDLFEANRELDHYELSNKLRNSLVKYKALEAYSDEE